MTPNTHTMVVIHRAFRRESRLLADLVDAVEPGDTARAGTLAAHLRDYLLGLHNHHVAEDRYLWPPLLARVDLDADIVLRMAAQHEHLAATLATIGGALPGWAATAGEHERDKLVAALVDHRAVLIGHLDDEETTLLPLAARHLTVAEWRAWGRYFPSVTPKPVLLTYLGLVLEDASPQERASFLGELPWYARAVWHLAGRPRYTHHIRRIRNTRETS
ncbi:hemerythrin domain-containing protein [Longispora albida]|uniref:hemerythrin domain-containing protein n=1 Tax=Longispora albida TaxID=203523 RepID=UPI00035D7C58|nr:hemerythrin domain-containing protein [Longispora albida]